VGGIKISYIENTTINWASSIPGEYRELCTHHFNACNKQNYGAAN